MAEIAEEPQCTYTVYVHARCGLGGSLGQIRALQIFIHCAPNDMSFECAFSKLNKHNSVCHIKVHTTSVNTREETVLLLV